MGGGKSGPAMESGDWTCVACGFPNFRRRSNCMRCNTLNPSLVPGGAGPMSSHSSMMRSQQQMAQQSHPQLPMLDTSLVDPFLLEDMDKPPHSRVPQSAGPGPSSANFLTRGMNNLSLGPLTTSYGGGYGAIGGGPLTAPPVGSDEEYEYGTKSASAVDRLGAGGFFSHRPGQD